MFFRLKLFVWQGWCQCSLQLVTSLGSVHKVPIILLAQGSVGCVIDGPLLLIPAARNRTPHFLLLSLMPCPLCCMLRSSSLFLLFTGWHRIHGLEWGHRRLGVYISRQRTVVSAGAPVRGPPCPAGAAQHEGPKQRAHHAVCQESAG